MNYFELFNLEEKYDIDLTKLHQRYLTLQVVYHPDNIKNNDSKKTNLSISIDLNKAYTILKDDILRAEYLLSLDHIDINASNHRTRLSKIQLQNIWHDLERIDELHDREILESEYRLKILEKAQILLNLTKAFDNKQLNDAIDIVISLKYLTNLIDKIKLKSSICK